MHEYKHERAPAVLAPYDAVMVIGAGVVRGAKVPAWRSIPPPPRTTAPTAGSDLSGCAIAMAASARSAAFGGAWPPPAAGEAVSAPLCAVSGLAAGAAAPANSPVASCSLILHAGHVFSSHAQVRRSGGLPGKYPSSNASIDLILSRQSLQLASVIAIVANISVCPSGSLSRHVGHRRHRHSRTAPLTGTGVGEARGAHRATRCLIAHVPPRGGHAPCACGSGSVAPEFGPSAGAVLSTTNSPCPTIAQRGAPRASHLRVTRTW